MIGTDSRHSSHSSPTIIWSQCERGAIARFTVARSMMITKGDAATIGEIRRSPPGRASRVK